MLLVGSALDAARYAVDVAQRARSRNGLPPSGSLARLAAALAVPGQTDSDEAPTREAEHMSIPEAAELLGCSTRTARRLAPGLGGQRIGGRWLLDRQTIEEHNEGRTHP